jgi:hypothetical protein
MYKEMTRLVPNLPLKGIFVWELQNAIENVGGRKFFLQLKTL